MIVTQTTITNAKLGVLLTRKEAATRLGIGLATLDVERTSGRLAYIQRRPGGKVWISETAITEYLEKALHPAKPSPIVTGNTYRKRRV